MYTEENEFNYNDYQEYDGNNGNNSTIKVIVKVLIVLLCLFLIIFVVFKISNSNKDNNKPSNEDYLLVFNNNLSILQDISEVYFFDRNNIPKEKNETVSVTAKELINENLLTDLKDYNNNACNYQTSLSTLTKLDSDYLMKVTLNCGSNSKSITNYYDSEFECLTCNGESYVPSEKPESDENNDIDNDNNDVDNDNEENNVCNVWSDWTDEYKNDSSLERRERVVIIGYKNNILYGEWTQWQKEEFEATSDIEIESETRKESQTTFTDWSDYQKSKPEEKDGREIQTKTEKEKYKTTTNSCKYETYTKDLTYWDSNALRCENKGIGKVTCTYQKKVCNPVTTTKYRTVTYYSYRDTETKEVDTIYYRSRTISQGDTVYTNYMLENELPSGYSVLEGSQKTQYSYRTICGK